MKFLLAFIPLLGNLNIVNEAKYLIAASSVYDLSKLSIGHNWSATDISKNDLNINLNGENFIDEENVYEQLLYSLDNTYSTQEEYAFDANKVFMTELHKHGHSGDPSDCFVLSIKDSSKNWVSSGVVNEGEVTVSKIFGTTDIFKKIQGDSYRNQMFSLDLEMKISDSKKFVITSKLDFSVNICNFNTESSNILADKSKGINTSNLPSNNVSSTDPKEVYDASMQKNIHLNATQTNSVTYNGHQSYGLNINKTNLPDASFSQQYVKDLNPKTGDWDFATEKWNWEGTKEEQNDSKNDTMPGKFKIKKFCPQFLNWDIASKYITNVSYTFNWRIKANSQTHWKDWNYQSTIPWNINQIIPIKDITSKDYFWNQGLTPDFKNITNYKQHDYNNNILCNPNGTYEFHQDFTSGSVYYAAFAVPFTSTSKTSLEFEVIFMSKLNGYLWAPMTIYYTLEGLNISYNYNASVFDNKKINYFKNF